MSRGAVKLGGLVSEEPQPRVLRYHVTRTGQHLLYCPRGLGRVYSEA